MDEDQIRPFEWLTSPKSLESLLTSLSLTNPRSALHVGSGSSTVGEFLVEHLSYEKVVDVDKDEETLRQMKERWERRCSRTGVDTGKLQHEVVDFTLSQVPSPDGSFELILDKSTLDCTLCSDNAAAALLVEVYRCLAVNGIYVLISFHEIELLRPLLEELPGSKWDITCKTMERQVERIDSSQQSTQPLRPERSSSQNPLNVLIAKKLSPGAIVFEEACAHVHRVNDSWFRESNPLLTHQRIEELHQKFPKPLPLKTAFEYLFTEAEREHLTYGHFLEDWQVFCSDPERSKNQQFDSSKVSYEAAVAFLNEMQ